MEKDNLNRLIQNKQMNDVPKSGKLFSTICTST